MSAGRNLFLVFSWAIFCFHFLTYKVQDNFLQRCISVFQLAQSTILYENISPLKDSDCEEIKGKKYFFWKNNHSKSNLITQTHLLSLISCLHSWCLDIVYLGSYWACAHLQNNYEEADLLSLGLDELQSHSQVQEGQFPPLGTVLANLRGNGVIFFISSSSNLT